MNDDEVRWHLYDITMREGTPPLVSRLAREMARAEDDVRTSLQRLEKRRMVVMQPGGVEILMAGPFSAVVTPFRVSVAGITCYANCVWDALGIPATLSADAIVDTSCGDCGAAARIEVRGREVIGDGFMHFALPARTWWDNIVFT